MEMILDIHSYFILIRAWLCNVMYDFAVMLSYMTSQIPEGDYALIGFLNKV